MGFFFGFFFGQIQLSKMLPRVLLLVTLHTPIFVHTEIYHQIQEEHMSYSRNKKDVWLWIKAGHRLGFWENLNTGLHAGPRPPVSTSHVLMRYYRPVFCHMAKLGILDRIFVLSQNTSHIPCEGLYAHGKCDKLQPWEKKLLRVQFLCIPRSRKCNKGVG